jgi:ribonuclease P protein component
MTATPRPGSARFPRACHLRRRRDFQRVFRAGGVSHGRYLSVRIVRRPAADAPPRLGLAVSRRAGNAPARNRIRRRIRELFRHRLATLPPGLDVVVATNRGDGARCAFFLLEEDFDRTLARALRRKRGHRG